MLILLALAATAFPRAAGAVRPSAGEPATTSDVESLAAIGSNPEQLATVRRADAAFAEGRWAEAAALFGALPTTDEDAARYPMRRRCQALTEQNLRDDAVKACYALLKRVVPEAADLQAVVAALMLGSGRPADGDLEQATLLLRRIEGLDPDSVWFEAARCNIAQRVGDRAALATCSARLAQLAPDSRLSRPFLQVAERSERGRWLKLGLLGLLGLGLLVTLLHRVLAGRRAATVASAALLTLCVSASASAQDATPPSAPNPVAESSSPAQPDAAESDSKAEDSEDTATAINRDMQLLETLVLEVNGAEELIKKDDWRGAIGKYVDVIKTAPYFVKGWRRLCEGYAYVNSPVEGAHACRQVLASKESNAWDRAMLVHHLLSGPDGKKPATRAEAKDLANAAVAMSPTERWGYDAQCELALLSDDFKTLKSCSEQLNRLAPDDRKTVALLFSAALHEKRLADAEKIIERAGAAGMDKPSLEHMSSLLDARRPALVRLWRSLPVLLGFGALAAVLVLLGRFLLNLRGRARNVSESH
ncbi:MAG TPA: hypothetical protein VHB79_32585 [Polyangiaceae bacterium]|nr:hypothetical protein [Polyangiaceae bacterium]